MKFKALAAAVALLSTASVANAGWHDGREGTPAVGNGELLLVVYDTVSKTSVMQDLGMEYATFYNDWFSATSGNVGFNLDTAAFASSGMDLSNNGANLQWSVFANNNGISNPVLPQYNSAGRETTGFMVTTNAANPVVSDATRSAIWNASEGGIGIKVNNGNTDWATDTATVGSVALGNYAGDDGVYGGSLTGQTDFSVVANGNESLYFWAFFDETAQSSVAGQTMQANGYWTLDVATGNVQYSAVPVPAAVWLLASGLLGLGAVSRRRKA